MRIFDTIIQKRSKRGTKKTNRKLVGPEVRLVSELEAASDEAYLEADGLSSSSSRHRRIPTDIADIIADSDISEQRLVASGFRPNGTPFGRHQTSRFTSFAPQSQTVGRRPPSTATKRAPPTTNRRPAPRPASAPLGRVKQSASHHRTPHSVQELEISSNSLVGSGNFDVLSGGIFRRSDNEFRLAPTRFSKPRDPPHFRFPSFNQDGFFSNFKDFADINRRHSGRFGGSARRRPLDQGRSSFRSSFGHRNRPVVFD